MADAGIIWWLDLYSGSVGHARRPADAGDHRLLIDLLSQLGLDVPDDMVLKPPA